MILVFDKNRIMALDDLVEQRLLWAVPLVPSGFHFLNVRLLLTVLAKPAGSRGMGNLSVG